MRRSQPRWWLFEATLGPTPRRAGTSGPSDRRPVPFVRSFFGFHPRFYDGHEPMEACDLRGGNHTCCSRSHDSQAWMSFCSSIIKFWAWTWYGALIGQIFWGPNSVNWDLTLALDLDWICLDSVFYDFIMMCGLKILLIDWEQADPFFCSRTLPCILHAGTATDETHARDLSVKFTEIYICARQMCFPWEGLPFVWNQACWQ